MRRRLSLQPHHPLETLERRYRAANDPIARSHRQVIWLLAWGLASAQIAAVSGYTINWVRPIAQRYNQHGPVGLEDRRHWNPGRMGLSWPVNEPRSRHVKADPTAQAAFQKTFRP